MSWHLVRTAERTKEETSLYPAESIKETIEFNEQGEGTSSGITERINPKVELPVFESIREEDRPGVVQEILGSYVERKRGGQIESPSLVSLNEVINGR